MKRLIPLSVILIFYCCTSSTIRDEPSKYRIKQKFQFDELEINTKEDNKENLVKLTFTILHEDSIVLENYYLVIEMDEIVYKGNYKNYVEVSVEKSKPYQSYPLIIYLVEKENEYYYQWSPKTSLKVLSNWNYEVTLYYEEKKKEDWAMCRLDNGTN